MSEQLQNERKSQKLNVDEVAAYVYHSKEKAQWLEKHFKMLGEDPILKNDPSDYEKSRIELMEICAKKGLRIHETLGLVTGSQAIVDGLHHFQEMTPYGVSTYMFNPYIKSLGTQKQIDKWVPRIEKMEVIGTYAQTELGHGSDIRSLETTATYDNQKDQFIIHSPTLTSMKWWPGEMGINCNHVVCMAQLIIGDKNHGVHGFLVQIRDLETNKPMPGIEVGDIGPKIGWATKDNGYLKFNQVRIPRENMLMKYTKVDKKGQYKRRGNEKIGYAIMMQIRDLICHGSWSYLSKALTIGVRYSIVRKQFRDEDKNERTILDYQTQQDKVLVSLANCYAMNAGAFRCTFLAQENVRKITESEDFSMMKDLHATLCACKSFYTQDCLDGLSIVRMSCGGHGFSSYSGFTKIIEAFIPNATYEGDNTVLALQTAGYLVKILQKVQSNPNKEIQENAGYLKSIQEILSVKKCQAKTSDDLTPQLLLDVLQANAACMVYTAGKTLMTQGQEVGFKNAWDKHAGIDLIEAARAHLIQFTMKVFIDKINEKAESNQLKGVLSDMACLYACEKLLKHNYGVLETGYLDPKQLGLLRQRKYQLLERIRPHSLALVDGFKFHDNNLGSAIGQYDGNVYETLVDWVQKYNGVNKHDWSGVFQKYIKPLRDLPPNPQPKL